MPFICIVYTLCITFTSSNKQKTNTKKRRQRFTANRKMKAITLQKRIDQNLTTQKGIVRAIYRDVINLIKNPTKTMRPISSGYSKGWSYVSDHSSDLIRGLELIGIDFETGNDAPRGGKSGFFVRLTKKGQYQVKDFNEAIRLEAKK